MSTSRRGLFCLSLLMSMLMAQTANAATFVVAQLFDSGTASLREAITNANASAGADTIIFSVPGTISLLSSLPALSDASGGTTVNGAGQISLSGVSITSGPLLTITSERNIIDGVSIVSTLNAAILIDGPNAKNNIIRNCRIGNNGTTALANFDGIIISNGASLNTIGGSTPSDRNIISGNISTGIQISDPTSTGNRVIGNYIGISSTGLVSLGNGLIGVYVFEAKDNEIGGAAAGEGNVISGSVEGPGISLYGADCTGNKIQGNLIGLDAGGKDPLPNLRGIEVFDGPNLNFIGGSTSGERNVISGNADNAIHIDFFGETADPPHDNFIQGNYIGTSFEGTAVAANGGVGVYLGNGCTNNTIGGATSSARNILSGNLDGVQVSNANSNFIQGNYIGIDVSGTLDLGNGNAGVSLIGTSAKNIIGGSTPGAGNVISGNDGNGIVADVFIATGDGNTIAGNIIGLNATGTARIPNSFNGIARVEASNELIIGGTSPGSRNIISGNTQNGILIGSGSNNFIQGNYIGVDITGSIKLGNDASGIRITSGSNTVGGNVAGAGNVISGNTNFGVEIVGFGASGNIVQGNLIGLDATGTSAIGNATGVLVTTSSNIIGGVTPEEKNTISGNSATGILLSAGVSNVSVTGNYIGTNSAGTQAIANQGDGIGIEQSASNNTIGGATAAERNVISGNLLNGIKLSDVETSQNLVLGNFIGVNATGDSAVANGLSGVLLTAGASFNSIGNGGDGEGNLISGNLRAGIEIEGSGTTNSIVKGNLIGTAANGAADLGNSEGIVILGADNSVIGGTATTDRNVISGNAGNGIHITNNPEGQDATGNTIVGNYIGPGVSGGEVIGNSGNGVLIDGNASNNLLGGGSAAEGNTIAFNTGDGIQINGASAIQNHIRRNRVFVNDGQGIALANGGNAEIAPPVLSIAILAKTFVAGQTAPNAEVDLFSDPGDEALVYIETVVSDFNGRFTSNSPVDSFDGSNITATVTDASGNTSEFSTPLDIDLTPPSVVSITRSGASTTNQAQVGFDVLFSKPVTGVDTSDFVVTTDLLDARVVLVEGSNESYSVVVDTGPGEGALRLDVVDDDSIIDLFLLVLGGDGTGNGGFTSGESYTIDRSNPTVTILSALPDPTRQSPIPIKVSFNEPVTGFISDDVSVGNGVKTDFGGSGRTYSFLLTPSAPGGVTVDIAGDVAVDAAGNPNTPATSFQRTFDPLLGYGLLVGVVIDADSDERIACAAIRAFNNQLDIERIATADLNGAYRMLELPAGNYEVEAFAPGYTGGLASVALAPDGERTLNFQLQTQVPTGAITGLVRDAVSLEPLVGARVDALGGDPLTLIATTFTCADGQFELNNIFIKDGEVTVEISAPNYESETEQVPPGNEEPLVVSLMLGIEADGTLAGVVRDSDNLGPLADARITINGLANMSATTNGDGEYIVALPSGSCVVEASAEGYEGVYRDTDIESLKISEENFDLPPGLAPTDPTDIDGNGSVDAVDVQLVINGALGLTIDGNADVDGNGFVDAVDVQLVINSALGII